MKTSRVLAFCEWGLSPRGEWTGRGPTPGEAAVNEIQTKPPGCIRQTPHFSSYRPWGFPQSFWESGLPASSESRAVGRVQETVFKKGLSTHPPDDHSDDRSEILKILPRFAPFISRDIVIGLRLAKRHEEKRWGNMSHGSSGTSVLRTLSFEVWENTLHRSASILHASKPGPCSNRTFFSMHDVLWWPPAPMWVMRTSSRT